MRGHVKGFNEQDVRRGDSIARPDKAVKLLRVLAKTTKAGKTQRPVPHLLKPLALLFIAFKFKCERVKCQR